MKHITYLLGAILFASTLSAKNIVTSEDLLMYNPQQQIKLMQSELTFWNKKLESSPDNFMYLSKVAGVHDAFFKITGQISDLKKAEQYIRKSILANHVGRESGYRSLAQNLISQHRFCEALDNAIEAEYLGGELRKTQMVLFDVFMELGDDRNASVYLDLISDRKDFNYLIRKAKWEDKIGNLDAAIFNLESAMTLAESSNDLSRQSWIYSNIADFYGHNGEIEKSKLHYEKALRINQADWYSVKKMAWIAWSAEDNPDLALTMLKDLKLFNDSPGIDLLIADIQSTQNNSDYSKNMVDQVFEKVSHPDYGFMYTAFINQQLLENGEYEAARKVAEDEISRRPSVDSYVLLMNYYRTINDLAAAKNVAKRHIMDRTFEPAILLDVQKVLDPESKEKQEIVDELKNCQFELGPLHYREIVKLVS